MLIVSHKNLWNCREGRNPWHTTVIRWNHNAELIDRTCLILIHPYSPAVLWDHCSFVRLTTVQLNLVLFLQEPASLHHDLLNHEGLLIHMHYITVLCFSSLFHSHPVSSIARPPSSFDHILGQENGCVAPPDNNNLHGDIPLSIGLH